MPSKPIPSFTPSKILRDVYVLVVDDDRRIAKLVRSVLLGLGFQHIELCHDAASALSLLEGQKFDMLICDWQMEPVSGIDMVQHLRRQDKGVNQRIPVIMLSGHTEQPQVEKARDAGITEYAIKPFTAKSLCSRIIAVIEHPRSFIKSPHFIGHNRRRKSMKVPEDRRKKRPIKGK